MTQNVYPVTKYMHNFSRMLNLFEEFQSLEFWEIIYMMNQMLCCDWLPTWTSLSWPIRIARYIPFLTKLAQSRWLNVELNFCSWKLLKCPDKKLRSFPLTKTNEKRWCQAFDWRKGRNHNESRNFTSLHVTTELTPSDS